jgi:hypothetical protein
MLQNPARTIKALDPIGLGHITDTYRFTRSRAWMNLPLPR